MDTNEANILYALLIAACVVAGLLVLFLVTILRLHRKNLMLYKERLRIEIETLEKERQRIATDLHDQFGPVLSTIKLQASVLEPGLGEAQILDKMKASIDDMLVNIRTISHNLVPNVLSRKGLCAAVKEFADSIADTGRMEIRLSFTSNMALPAYMEVHIFRIIQESLNNAIKHSGSKVASVVMHKNSREFILVISDQGKGLEHAGNEIIGSGMQNIRNRVELLKGRMHIKTKPGNGLHYTIQIPIYEKRIYQSNHS